MKRPIHAASSLLFALALVGRAEAAVGPTAVIREASPMRLPGLTDPAKQLENYVDCNNPCHWDGTTMYIFSSAGHPFRSSGPDLMHLNPQSERTAYDNEKDYNGGRWIEATHKAEDGTLYGWYHREPGDVCPGKSLTAPEIGAVVSSDNGMNWRDLGIILKAPDDSIFCDTPNKYFAGGNGDFSVIPDQQKEYLYFLISTYHKDPTEQGVTVARMRYADRDMPVGKVFKWYRGQWKQPGLGGRVTPIFGPTIDWHKPRANVLWGPSIHWNTHLERYVMLLNLARDKDWTQEGIYVSINRDIVNPEGWSKPEKILDASRLEASKWYPQVIGTNAAGRETDKLAGRVARLFVAGRSKWEIIFLKPGEARPAGLLENADKAVRKPSSAKPAARKNTRTKTGPKKK
ncbi:MAG: hypothetical protein QUV05_18010 [Phycisphaerae bacterium]|nr:hypothetical protein [Phycisphaerae bacterium]